MRHERRVRIVGAAVVLCCVLAALGAATVAGVGGAGVIGAGGGHAAVAPSASGALAADDPEVLPTGDTVGERVQRLAQVGDESERVCGQRLDEEEPNDDRDSVTGDLWNGFYVDGRVNDSGDVDWYAFEAGAGIDIRLEGVAVGEDVGDLTLTLYAPDGTVVTQRPIAEGANETTYMTAEGVGRYYARITGSDAGTGCYAFQAGTYHWEDEPNDDREGATPVEPGWDTEVGGTLAPEGDTADWYAVDVNAGQSIRVDRIGPTATGPGFDLVAPDGTVVDESSGNTEVTAMGTTATESGTYYVRVTPRMGGAKYSFDVDIGTPDQRESNDDRGSAAPVAANTQFGATITEASPRDWYAVELDAGERLNATLEQTDIESAVGNEVGLAIVAPDRSRVGEIPPRTYGELSNETGWAGTSFHTRATQRATAETAGTYYVRATGDRMAGFFTYSLSLETQDTTASDLREVTVSAEGAVQTYAFSARRVVPGERANLADGTDSVDGASVEGTVGEGGTDTYYVAGPIEGFVADAPDRLTVSVAGEQVDPGSLGGDEPSKTIRIDAEGSVQEYTLSAPNLAAGDRANIDDGTDVIDGETASGTIGEGGADTYRFSGSIEAFTADASERLTISVDGESVDPAALGPEPERTIWLRGTGTVQEYAISAPNLTAGERANVEDSTDVIEGETVSGTIGEGGVDTYHFSGSIREFRADVPERLAVRIDDQQVDPGQLAGEDATPTPTTAPTTQRTTATPETTRRPATTTAAPATTTAAATTARATTAAPTTTEATTRSPTARSMTGTATVTASPPEPTTRTTATTTASGSATTTSSSTTDTDAATASGGSVGEIAGDDTPTETSGGSGPGVGILGAVVAFLVGVGVLARRHR